MFCSNCGSQIEDGSVFCSSCGSQVGGNPVNNQAAPVVNNAYANPNAYGAPVYMAQPAIGLTWAHFLGYGLLWVGALFNFIISLCYIMGTLEIQDVPMEYYYMYYGDSLMYADKFYGILGCGMVALEVVAAVCVINYKKNAGNLVFALYLSHLIAAFLILVIKIAVTGDAEMGILQFISIPYSLVMTIVNKFYFDNRKAIFVR
jgi:hypothetical protein